MTTDTPLRRLGPYELRSQIGEGGMGVVYRSVGAGGKPVAVKVLRPDVAIDGDSRDRFAREVRAMRRIRGPFVAEVIDAELTGETPYVVTRYVNGPPLSEVVEKGGPLGDRALVRLGRGLTEALAAIHAAGVIHRDLKPANVLMVDGQPVVIDFGIAHVVDENKLTKTGLVIGTPGYLAPEVIEGRPATRSSDVHSLGATLAFAATGRPPFGRGALEGVVSRVVSGKADLEGCPDRLEMILRLAMHRDPRRRPAPAELGSLISRGVGSRPRPTRPGTRPVAVMPAMLPTPRAVSARPIGVQRARDAVPRARAMQPLPARRPEPQPGPEQRPRTAEPPAALQPQPLFSMLLLALAMAVGAVAPFVALLCLGLALAMFRTVDRQGLFLHHRRERRGRSPSDSLVAVTALPWHLTRSGLFTLLTLPLAAIGAAAVVVLLALFAPAGLHATNPHALGALGLGVTSLFAWWGIEGDGLRAGSRRALAWVASPRPVALVFALVVAVAAVAFLVEAFNTPVHWWPLEGSGLRHLPRLVVGWLRDHRFF
ncbi:MAG TPA: protein kinase [Streptosporangiales bacterium]